MKSEGILQWRSPAQLEVLVISGCIVDATHVSDAKMNAGSSKQSLHRCKASLSISHVAEVCNGQMFVAYMHCCCLALPLKVEWCWGLLNALQVCLRQHCSFKVDQRAIALMTGMLLHPLCGAGW